MNRHKKVKHGLNETTDVMEEDAVNFLSSLSERARDDQHGEGDGNSLSGDDDPEGKLGRKGRKSIPRKIMQGEEEVEGSYQEHGGAPHPQGTGLPQDGHVKPFVIPNPDTDDEGDEDAEKRRAGGQLIGGHADVASSVMNFQPLNNVHHVAEDALEYQQHQHRKRAAYHHPDENEMDKRPRRQSQRKSPKVHPGEMGGAVNSDDDADGDLDNADDDWVPGSKRRSKMRVEERLKSS